jgi:HD-GYP domain-containing protein (c-di-GMP phosphodiesterase class II)
MTDSPFKLISSARHSFAKVCEEVQQQQATDIPARVVRIAKILQIACGQNGDAAISCILLKEKTNLGYCINHSVDTAIICEFISRRMNWDPNHRTRVVAAALTMNFGMIELQNHLYSYQGKLDDEAIQQINVHPKQSIEILQAAGITDPDWLNGVLHHHERMDGHGYPDGLKNRDIPEFARIIALADVYTAMVSPRAHRDGLYPDQVTRDLFIKGGIVDISIGSSFVGEFGLYPPGTLVKLNSGETAVVIKRGHSPRKPIIHVLFNADNLPINESTNREDYLIQEVIRPLADNPYIDRHKLWGYESINTTQTHQINHAPEQHELEQTHDKINRINIPIPSSTVNKLCNELNNVEPESGLLQAILNKDQHLFTLLMKVIASPILAYNPPIASLEEAMSRLGPHLFKKLLLIAALRKEAALLSSKLEIKDYWAESALSAMCAARLSQSTEGIEIEEAFLGGFMQAFSELLMIQNFPDYRQASQEQVLHPLSCVEMEDENYDTNHTLVAYITAKKWGLSDSLCLSLYHHHTSTLKSIQNDNIRTGGALLALANNCIADWNALMSNEQTEEQIAYRTDAMEELLISEYDFRETGADLTDQIDTFIEDIISD